MENRAFEAFFRDVLETRIPALNKIRIQAYWQRFKATPQLFLEDDQIRQVEVTHGRKFRYAGVCGYPCLSIFAFRMSVFHDAPEKHLRSLIQHELIHVDYRSDDTLEKLSVGSIPEFSPRGSNKISSQVNRVISSFKAERLDEYRVRLINSKWGGDEEALDAWIANKEQLSNRG